MTRPTYDELLAADRAALTRGAWPAARGQFERPARLALWLGDDHNEFRGADAVAEGWFNRAGRDPPPVGRRGGGVLRHAVRPGGACSRGVGGQMAGASR
ncbi:hypothetical protein ACIA58_08850 [Kribbella sp. NPDC051586]|uniref:hypothetical protein n=1 Tax=Kribbella sp. NPDC051586 TaxID=3364118 RepID=UPI0037924454